MAKGSLGVSMLCRDVLLFLGFTSLSVPAMAADFWGLRIGMTQEDALRVLNARGTAKSAPLKDTSSTVPQTLIWIDSMNVTICRGRVSGMSRTLTNTFATWAREMRVAVAERGDPTEWRVGASEADPQVHSVQADWKLPGAATYSIDYIEVNRERLVSEKMFAPCR